MSSPSHERPRVGFIGLGVMGHPMAGHLAAAGYQLSVFDTDPAAVQRLLGVHPQVVAVDRAAAVGERSDVVMTMLPDGEQVRLAAIGPDGLIETMQPGSIVVDASSAQPWLTTATATALGRHQIAMIDTPVSGAQWGAEQADLVFMVGGDLADVERVRPILDLLGRAVFHCGPLGSGHTMKSINNTITAMTFIATIEGLALGTRAGLDPAAMTDVLNESTGGSWISIHHIGQRILSRTLDDPFRLELMVKDIAIANRLARDLQVKMPLSSLGETMYESAEQHAGPGKSLSELARWIEFSTGVDIVPSSVR